MDAVQTSTNISYNPFFEELFEENFNKEAFLRNFADAFQCHGISAANVLENGCSQMNFSADHIEKTPIEDTQIQACQLFFDKLFAKPSASVPFIPPLEYKADTSSGLPKEMWTHILTNLITEEPNWQDMLNIALTCKQLANIVFSHSILQLFFRQGPTDLLNLNINTAANIVSTFLRYAPHLAIEYASDSSLLEQSITNIISCQYDSFSFEQEPETEGLFFSDRNIEQLAIHSPHMHTLSLKGCSLSTDAPYYLAAYCRKLKSVNLSDISSLSNAALSALAIQSPELEHFQLRLKEPAKDASQTEQPVIEQGLYFLARSCKNIKSIILDNCPISDKALQYISRECAESLDRLELIDCKQFSNEGMKTLLKCQNISQFVLLGTSGILNGNLLKQIASDWTKLQKIEIRNATQIQHEALKEFCEKSKNLEILIFDQLNVNPEILKGIFSESKKLTELHFASSCKYTLSGQEIARLFQENRENLPHLKEMRFDSDYPLFTLEDLQSIATMHPHLVLHLETLPDESILDQLHEEFLNFIIDNLA